MESDVAENLILRGFMKKTNLSLNRVRQILEAARQTQILVLGDVMLDQFLWGHVARISPEAPVPIVEFERESFMPGGAANVARNIVDLNAPVELFGIVGRDDAAKNLKRLLLEHKIGCAGVLSHSSRMTSIKTRIVAHRQQVVRVDRESRHEIEEKFSRQLLDVLQRQLAKASALILGDYGKGVVTQKLLDEIKKLCRDRGIWLSLDPKPVHNLRLQNLSLVTPNRKEAFQLAQISDDARSENPLEDKNLMRVAEKLLAELSPAVLLITLGDRGMLLCQRGQKPFHIPTMAREVFDVSGAGDTVIASFTLAIAAGASPIEAAIFSNHAAGIVVGKVGTASVQPDDLLKSFRR